MTALYQAAALLGAGIIAGLVGTAGGITSLISYPALLAVGIPALSANITNIVAILACWPGSALASGPELTGKGPWLRRWLPVAAVGGALGSALLLSTPTRMFGRIVPFLVITGSLALLVQPQLSARRPRLDQSRTRMGLPAGLLLLAVYGGYFGAGSGVMILALLLFTTDSDLPSSHRIYGLRGRRLDSCRAAQRRNVHWQHARAADHTVDATNRLALAGRHTRHSRGHPAVAQRVRLTSTTRTTTPRCQPSCAPADGRPNRNWQAYPVRLVHAREAVCPASLAACWLV